MRDFKYDFHVHSCLSPCAENDMTPANIAGLASLLGLEIVALTDHNTSANCPAFFAAAKRHGIVPVGGMELTTAEDIHVICLFDTRILRPGVVFCALFRKFRHNFKLNNALAAMAN